MVDGAVVDELLARTSSGGTTAWYLTDKLDSVRDVVGSSGTVLDHVVYDSFGSILTETNASNGDRFKFAGMEYDSTTGQYYDHARWYGSLDGRFLSQDPTWFSAGDTDFYRLVGNVPTDNTDPTGLRAGDVLGTVEEAAKDWANYYNGSYIMNNIECGSTIYKKVNGKYVYIVPNEGTQDRVKPSYPPNKADQDRVVARIHSHGAYDPSYESGGNSFSDSDRGNAETFGRQSYLSTPNGSLLQYDPTAGQLARLRGDDVTEIPIEIPSDPNDPSRKNQIDPSAGPPKPPNGST